MIKETLAIAEAKMKKAIEFTKEEFAAIRTGRANPNMFNKLTVDYYGVPTPIPQLASVSAPEARLLIIKPYDQSQLVNIETIIRNSDLGVNPTNDGQVLRITIPALTQERRSELVKQTKAKGEEAKIALRNIRRKSMEELHELQKIAEASEDEVTRAEKELTKITTNYVENVDILLKHKETELLET